MAATLEPVQGGNPVVCRTRDLSDVGVCLDTAARYPLGTQLSIALIDPNLGAVIEVLAEVVREAEGPHPQLGVRLVEPGDDWRALVASIARRSGKIDGPTRRLRVLVVGDDQRQRGAMALYVTSGWDVLFASDQDSVLEALDNVAVDAVIAEVDADDPRWQPVMHDVRRVRPRSRRIVRGAIYPGARDELVDRFVDREAGLDALLDALTAELPNRPAS
jgi:hypothetical protein